MPNEGEASCFRQRINQSSCRMSHTFDGKTLTKETAAFQLCDILDPMLKGMIEDPEALRETCHVRLKVSWRFTAEVKLTGKGWVVFYACTRTNQNGIAAQIFLAFRGPSSLR